MFSEYSVHTGVGRQQGVGLREALAAEVKWAWWASSEPLQKRKEAGVPPGVCHVCSKCLSQAHCLKGRVPQSVSHVLTYRRAC